MQEILTEYELIVDSYEQPIERPGDYERQKKYYSGKKKNHTRKGQVIVLPNGKDLVDVEVGKPGKVSDINIFRETLEKFNKEQRFSGDKAYQGESVIKTPKKKPRKGKLTESEKLKNRELSQSRIYVEHLIRLLKIFRVVQEKFRLKPEKYESITRTICGLIRLRIGALIFE